MMSSGKQYGLLIKKKPQPQVSRKSVFDDSDDESESKKVGKMIARESLKNLTKRQTQVEMKKALEEDPTVYDYDNIYDDIQKKKEIAKAAIAPKERKARYIQSLLKSAEQRKKDNERRIERQIQKERQEEGEKFADKEKFVTSAYKKKMEAMQEEEEREERESKLEEMMDVRKQNDLSGFYRHFLNQSTGEEAVPEFGKRFLPSSETATVKTEKMSPPREITNDGEKREKSNVENDVSNKAKEALVKHRSFKNTEDHSEMPTSAVTDNRITSELGDEGSRKRKTNNTESDTSSDSDGLQKASDRKRSKESNEKKSSQEAPQKRDRAKRKSMGSDSDSNISSDSSSESEDASKKSKPVGKESTKGPRRHDSHSESEISPERDIAKRNTKNGEGNGGSMSRDSIKKENVTSPTSEKQNSEDSNSSGTAKSRKNIFEKRTVGDVFIEAKARYLARKESRETARRVFSSA